jgi:hypothetical protein
MLIFALHRYGRRLGLDAIILARAARGPTGSAATGLSGRWLNALT